MKRVWRNSEGREFPANPDDTMSGKYGHRIPRYMMYALGYELVEVDELTVLQAEAKCEACIYQPHACPDCPFVARDDTLTAATQAGSADAGSTCENVPYMNLASEIRGHSPGLSERENCEIAAEIVADAIREAKREVSGGGSWRGIESAPKDGTEILVLLEKAIVPVVHVARWETWENDDDPDPGWWSYVQNSVAQEKLDNPGPTHWMPFHNPYDPPKAEPGQFWVNAFKQCWPAMKNGDADLGDVVVPSEAMKALGFWLEEVK